MRIWKKCSNFSIWQMEVSQTSAVLEFGLTWLWLIWPLHAFLTSYYGALYDRKGIKNQRQKKDYYNSQKWPDYIFLPLSPTLSFFLYHTHTHAKHTHTQIDTHALTISLLVVTIFHIGLDSWLIWLHLRRCNSENVAKENVFVLVVKISQEYYKNSWQTIALLNFILGHEYQLMVSIIYC